MATSASGLAVWTAPGMKVQLQKLLKLSELAVRTRVSTWQKQRDQIMAWVAEHVSELREIPAEVEALTEGLIEAELFTVDVAGALVPGPWPVSAGAWAVRKGIEAEKFGAVSEWARSILALRVSVPTIAAPGAVAGGAGASGSGGAAPSGVLTAPTAAAGGSGADAPAGRPQARGTHAMDPQSIAAAIAAAVGAKLDALGERLATLEAQRSATGGAPTVLSGTEPAEAKELRCAIRDSVATVEDWDVPRCVQACADLVHEAAKLRPQLTALRGVHPFGKAPMHTLEAHAFDPLAYILPELRAEECELDELPPGSEATLEHWRAFVHLLQARLGEFQRFVKSQVPTFPILDVMVASFFRKRKRVTFESEEEEARAAGGGHGALPPLDAARRDRLATLGAGFRTVNEEQLARARRGELAPEDVVRPPVQRLQQEDEGRLKLKDGELTMVAKKKKCKDFAEWERGFLRILCEAPAEARDDLMDFVEWARTIAAEFSFYRFNEFYEHLVRQVQRSATGISLDGYDRVWRVYKQTTGLKEKGAKKPKDRYSWRRDAEEQPRPTVPEDAGGGREGVPVAAPDPMVEADAELEFGQPIAVEDVGAVDAHVGCGPPDVEDGGAEPGDLGIAFRAMADTLLGEMAAAAGGYFAHGNDRAHGGMRHEQGRAEVCGVRAGWPSEVIDLDEPYRVPNYVGPEHMDVMREEIRRESEDGHIFLAGWRLPLGIIALGMVEKVLEFMGVLLDTSGEVCTASYDEERIAVVVQKAGDLRAQAARGMVARRRLESLLGLLAFCSHVVWGLSLYTRRGFSFLTATTGRRMVRLPRPVLDDLSVLEQKFDGHIAWGNLPFSIMFAILKNFLMCKRRQQWGTAACFLVPVWDGDAGWELMKSLPQELQREAERYRVEALAPETRRCYGTGVRAFVTFCITFACLGCLEPLLLATDVTLCMFITYCSCYAGHSLRRGGATAAMRLDVASIYIKMQGDWKSDCFERYCELDTEQKLILPGAMAEAAAVADR
ncbi:hypothetical protein CYMTET_51559 [Cymbomonas tetramitiformis]|uniref:Uncharacterized protein n=1 Tax=Cymbomonas tetramitiformis TaxID=36881 RepID=A0AAE0BM20_9CHLO|nr:hypothetical protein CYMTET_51559 [Cymbomonas tetramitiformis]